MDSRLRVSGNPIDPLLVMFPFGLVAVAIVFDAGNLWGGPALLGEVAYWSFGAGLVGGFLAALAGAIDLMYVPNGTAGKRHRVVRGLITMGVLLVFAVIFMVRMGLPDRAAGGGLLLVEALAFVAAVACTVFSGRLAERLTAAAFARPESGHRTAVTRTSYRGVTS